MATATILVVDDHPDLLKMMKAMLSQSSYDVLTAESERAAFDVLRSTPHVDLVISETDLPEGSGSELVHSVQRSFPSTAVMLMTAYTEQRLDPALPCLHKPFTILTLANRVREVLAQSKAAVDGLQAKLIRSRQQIQRSVDLEQQTADAWSGLQETINRSRELRTEWLSQQSTWQRPTVLVAEDDPFCRNAICRFLFQKGFAVLSAKNYDEALRLWQRRHEAINVVLVALNELDGAVLSATVESDCPKKPIVFITAAEAAVPHPMLRKPFQLDDLLAVVGRALGWK